MVINIEYMWDSLGGDCGENKILLDFIAKQTNETDGVRGEGFSARYLGKHSACIAVRVCHCVAVYVLDGDGDGFHGCPLDG